jgi:spermidine synthase
MTIRFYTRENFVEWFRGNREKPLVYEDEGVRSLHFGCLEVQSSMRLSNPYDLELSYTQTMMGFLLFISEPKHILIVGLGGGSLSKYCYRHFSNSRITTLEINPEVIAFRDDFLIPKDDDRFQILQTDASDFLAQSDIQADIILLDGYDAEGLPASLRAESFYSHCWRILEPGGVLVANFLGNDPFLNDYLDRLYSVFNRRVWKSKAFEGTNLIAFAVKDENYIPHWPSLFMKAHGLADRYKLDLPKVVRNMRQSQSQTKTKNII